MPCIVDRQSGRLAGALAGAGRRAGADAILQYAVRWGFNIVRTYADNGKSGLRLDGRDALKQLLIDVKGGSPVNTAAGCRPKYSPASAG